MLLLRRYFKKTKFEKYTDGIMRCRLQRGQERRHSRHNCFYGLTAVPSLLRTGLQ